MSLPNQFTTDYTIATWNKEFKARRSHCERYGENEWYWDRLENLVKQNETFLVNVNRQCRQLSENHETQTV